MTLMISPAAQTIIEKIIQGVMADPTARNWMDHDARPGTARIPQSLLLRMTTDGWS
jgi:hypothetical protein